MVLGMFGYSWVTLDWLSFFWDLEMVEVCFSIFVFLEF